MKKSITLILSIALVGITTLAVSSSDSMKQQNPESVKNIDKVSATPTPKSGYLEDNEAKWD